MSKDLTKPADAPLATVQPDPFEILRMAVQSGTRSVEELERLIGLAERMSAKRAEIQFNEALASFRSQCPPIIRRSENEQFMVTRKGVKRPSKYASLQDIDSTIRGPMSDDGLVYCWDDAVISDNEKMMTMACVLSHVGGHSRRASFTLPVESRAGASPQQKYGTVHAYLQRYTLIQVAGLTSCDDDDDGQSGAPAAKITPEQAQQIEDLINQSRADRKKFIDFVNEGHDGADIIKVADITTDLYEKACSKLEQKIKANMAKEAEPPKSV